MERITAEEAGKRIFEILERAAHGERLIITHDGRDKAEIGPVEAAAIRRARKAADTIRELRKHIRPFGIPLKDTIEDEQFELWGCRTAKNFQLSL